jgi:hypothetical protein
MTLPQPPPTRSDARSHSRAFRPRSCLHHLPEIIEADLTVAVRVGSLDQHFDILLVDRAVAEGFEDTPQHLRIGEAGPVRIVRPERLTDWVIRAEVIGREELPQRVLGEGPLAEE